MTQDFDWDEGESGVSTSPREPSHADEVAQEARLARQRRFARRLARSNTWWKISLAIAIFYATLTASMLQRGGPVFTPPSITLPLAALMGAGGTAGMIRFEASIRFYELFNAKYYRDRRRLIDQELNAVIGNVLFAGAGVGSVAGFAVHYLLAWL